MPLDHGIRHFDIARLALLSIVLLSIAVLFGACSSRVPARVETIDGRQVEIATAGAGGAATVVFEAGTAGAKDACS